MTTRAFHRGHPIEYNGNQWIYSDTRESILVERICVRCGELPTKEGYDACLGHVEGVSSACCGHGVEKPYEVKIEPNKPNT